MNAFASELENVLSSSEPRLRAFDDKTAGARPGPGKWCKKEILGHLIDSASNNHQRFVRLQSETALTLPAYEQNHWVRSQDYVDRSWGDLVDFWLAYNRHLAHVVRQVDRQATGNTWKSPAGEVTLGFLIEDYVRHLRHHLDQILENR